MKAVVGAVNMMTMLIVCATCLVAYRNYRDTTRSQPVTLTVPIDFSRTERTLLIVMEVGCEACESSVSFYREVVQRRMSIGRDLQIVVATPSRQGDAEQYVRSRGLSPDRFTFIDPGVLPMLRVAPTLLVADRKSRLLKMWEGSLSFEGEMAVKQYLGLS